jgi:hypothetical protein
MVEEPKSDTTNIQKHIPTEPVKDSFFRQLIAQIGAPTIRGICVLAVVGVVVYKFATSDTVISWDSFKEIALLIIGYFFGKEATK